VKPLLLAAYIASFAADGASTDYGLAHGAHERVLPTQSRAGVALIMSGEAIGGYAAYKWLKPKHPKLAKTVYIIIVASHSAGAAWNAHYSLMR